MQIKVKCNPSALDVMVSSACTRQKASRDAVWSISADTVDGYHDLFLNLNLVWQGTQFSQSSVKFGFSQLTNARICYEYTEFENEKTQKPLKEQKHWHSVAAFQKIGMQHCFKWMNISMIGQQQVPMCEP